MNRLYFLFLLFLGVEVSSLFAQMPATQRTAAYYSRFVQSSPFTEAPPASQNVVQEPSALSQWALNGFAIIGDKQMVILQSKKTPSQKIFVLTGEKNENNIEILEIQRGKSYLEDKVKLRLAGAVEGWITYDLAAIKKIKPNLAPNSVAQPAQASQPQTQAQPAPSPAKTPPPTPPSRRH